MTKYELLKLMKKLEDIGVGYNIKLTPEDAMKIRNYIKSLSDTLKEVLEGVEE